MHLTSEHFNKFLRQARRLTEVTKCNRELAINVICGIVRKRCNLNARVDLGVVSQQPINRPAFAVATKSINSQT